MKNKDIKLQLITKGYILLDGFTSRELEALRKHIQLIRKSGFIVYKNRIAYYTPQQKNAFEVNHYSEPFVIDLDAGERRARLMLDSLIDEAIPHEQNYIEKPHATIWGMIKRLFRSS